jgi:hypothetical protein
MYKEFKFELRLVEDIKSDILTAARMRDECKSSGATVAKLD